MIEATSCGGVVIYRGKILLLYKNFHDKNSGWVLPKGTVEEGETFEQTALREVKEEAGSDAEIVRSVGDTHYEFKTREDNVNKSVHWFLMSTDSFYSKPQRKEHFEDSGFYKYHEAIYLVKYDNEREILEKAYEEYRQLRKAGEWKDT